MFNYFFKNVNTLFLTCALAFISIANAQVISVVNEKGNMETFLKPTIAELYIGGTVGATIPFGGRGIFVPFVAANIYTGLPEDGLKVNHYTFPITKNHIVVKKPGTYKVSYRVTAERVLNIAIPPAPNIIDDGSGAGIEYKLYRNRAGGFATVPGSYSYSYHTGFNDGAGTASASRVMPLQAGDKLYVHAKIYSPSSSGIFTMRLDTNGSSFLVERIK